MCIINDKIKINDHSITEKWRLFTYLSYNLRSVSAGEVNERKNSDKKWWYLNLK